ncbi:hypothetical protein ZHAS_00005856 [Anopheles sinensis]|uniref:Uncharacterized protein n=1 Tax=Anopheles sinensis TaxID=74873 RepID=A0A084VKG3_ANOSI|nr:hypothetical protein ZHAS_00005856 [Anopheles sinensis]
MAMPNECRKDAAPLPGLPRPLGSSTQELATANNNGDKVRVNVAWRASEQRERHSTVSLPCAKVGLLLGDLLQSCRTAKIVVRRKVARTRKATSGKIFIHPTVG